VAILVTPYEQFEQRVAGMLPHVTGRRGSRRIGGRQNADSVRQRLYPPKGGNRERPHSGVRLISIQMVRPVAYLFLAGKLSNPPNLVRLRADSRHVAD
jgi:hypothetical protein